jgi:uncharacterized membrane protein
MSTEKEIEFLALGYAVGGRQGMGWVAYAILIKMLLPVFGVIVMAVVYGAMMLWEATGWRGVFEILGTFAFIAVPAGFVIGLDKLANAIRDRIRKARRQEVKS